MAYENVYSRHESELRKVQHHPPVSEIDKRYPKRSVDFGVNLTRNQVKHHGMPSRPVTCHRIPSLAFGTEEILLDVTCVDGYPNCEEFLCCIRASDCELLVWNIDEHGTSTETLVTLTSPSLVRIKHDQSLVDPFVLSPYS